MTDLMAELGKGGGGDDDFGRYSKRPEDEVTASVDDATKAFFSKVADIQARIHEIDADQRKLRQLHEDSKTAVQNEKTKQIRRDMAEATDHVKLLAKTVKGELDQLDAMNEQYLKSGPKVGSNEERTRTQVTNNLKRKLARTMDDFTALRSSIMSQYRDVVERRFYTVTGAKPSEEQIDELIETGEAENMFQKAILTQGRGKLIDTMREINERHQQVKELETSLLELHQMFLDMAVLIEQQGAQLDNIEKQVARAAEHVQQGTTHLHRAKILQKNTRKWMCCALIILLIIVAIIVVVAIQPWKSSGGSNNSPTTG